MQEIQLLITMDKTGQVIVNGPVDQKMLCLGLLEMAKIAVTNFVPSPIIKPNGSDLKVVN
jgi:hypothetical protein